MTLGVLLLAALAAAAYLLFALGVVASFRKVESEPAMLTVLKVGAVVSAILEVRAILKLDRIDAAALLGAALYLSSIALFLRCAQHTRTRKLTLAFSGDTPLFVLTTGPWRYVRHPFYLAYLVSYVAGFVATRDPLLLVVIAGMGAIYGVAIRREEAKLQGSPVAAEWSRWRARTGMLLPKLGSSQARSSAAEAP